MSSEPDDGRRRDGPADRPGREIDEFDAIVAGWDSDTRDRDAPEPRWPDGPDDPEAVPAEPAEPADSPDRDRPEDHFVPPEPPPLPRMGPPAMVGLGLLALGLVLCVQPTLIGIPDAYGLPLGLVMLAAGLGWSVLRLWPDPPAQGDGHGEDDGARL